MLLAFNDGTIYIYVIYIYIYVYIIYTYADSATNAPADVVWDEAKNDETILYVGVIQDDLW